MTRTEILTLASKHGFRAAGANPGGYILTAQEDALEHLVEAVVRNEQARCAERIRTLEDKLDKTHAEMSVVWDYLQEASPWSESNDMGWADEIISGIGLLEQKLAAAQEALAKVILP